MKLVFSIFVAVAMYSVGQCSMLVPDARVLMSLPSARALRNQPLFQLAITQGRSECSRRGSLIGSDHGGSAPGFRKKRTRPRTCRSSYWPNSQIFPFVLSHSDWFGTLQLPYAAHAEGTAVHPLHGRYTAVLGRLSLSLQSYESKGLCNPTFVALPLGCERCPN